MTSSGSPTPSSIVLVPGHWIGAWAWEAVAGDLRDRGHRVLALTLPGLDPDDPERISRTLGDQVTALRHAVAQGADAAPVVVVAHSGAGYPTSLLLEEDPTLVERVVYVDSGPASDQAAFDASVGDDVDEVPLPPFDGLGASLEGISETDLARFRERAVPEPATVMREVVALSNDARRDVPTTIVCSSFPSEVVLAMARDGNPMMAEVANLRNLELVDLPTGHWPMWSRPVDLAAAIAEAARAR